jgi:hypothetical protein
VGPDEKLSGKQTFQKIYLMQISPSMHQTACRIIPLLGHKPRASFEPAKCQRMAKNLRRNSVKHYC